MRAPWHRYLEAHFVDEEFGLVAQGFADARADLHKRSIATSSRAVRCCAVACRYTADTVCADGEARGGRGWCVFTSDRQYVRVGGSGGTARVRERTLAGWVGWVGWVGTLTIDSASDSEGVECAFACACTQTHAMLGRRACKTPERCYRKRKDPGYSTYSTYSTYSGYRSWLEAARRASTRGTGRTAERKCFRSRSLGRRSSCAHTRDRVGKPGTVPVRKLSSACTAAH